MKLLYKDLVLAVHPTFFVFTLLGCLVLVPAYPYTVVFLFGCLAPYISFMYARETNDAWFTALLPVKKAKLSHPNFVWFAARSLPNSVSRSCLLCCGFCFIFPTTPLAWIPPLPGLESVFSSMAFTTLSFSPHSIKPAIKRAKLFFWP